jgi:hypothetical protein
MTNIRSWITDGPAARRCKRIRARPVSTYGRRVSMLAVLLLSPGLMAAGDTAAPSRYRLEAELRPLAVSACGRFALDARARSAPEAQSADGRYALKAVHVPAVGCDPFPDPVFADGFEGP